MAVDPARPGRPGLSPEGSKFAFLSSHSGAVLIPEVQFHRDNKEKARPPTRGPGTARENDACSWLGPGRPRDRSGDAHTQSRPRTIRVAAIPKSCEINS